MVGSSTTLIKYFEATFSPQILKGTKSDTRQKYRNAVRKFIQWSGCDIQIHLVNETLIERFGKAIVAEGMNVQNARAYEVYVRRVARHRYPDTCMKKMGKRPHEWKGVDITGLSDEELRIENGIMKFFEEQYIPKRMIACSTCGINHHRYNIRRFAKFLGRPPLLTDLTDDRVCEFLSWILASDLSIASANCSRSTLLAVWRYAVKRGLLQEGPRDVEKLNERRQLPTAWTMEEMGLLIESARKQQRPKTGLPCPAGIWFEAFVLVAYDTGLRLRALLGIRRKDWIPERREISVSADFQKHAVAQTFVVSEQTAEAIQRMISNWSGLSGDDVFLFTWPACREALHYSYKSILKRAGLHKSGKDSFHKLRRTAATHLTAAIGLEAASRQLGHSSVDMTRRYVDPRFTGAHNAAEHLPRPKHS